MNAKDQFDACMKLAEFGAGRWDARRQYEWRISFGLWAVLGFVAYNVKDVPTIPDSLGLVIILGYAMLVQRNIFLANHADKHLSDAFRRHGQNLLGVPYAPPPRGWGRIIDFMNSRWWLNRSIAFLFDWAVLFQIIVTAGLVVLIYERCQKAERPFLGWPIFNWL